MNNISCNIIKIAYSYYENVYMLHIAICRQTSNVSLTLVGNKIVDDLHVVSASPVGAASTTSSLSN